MKSGSEIQLTLKYHDASTVVPTFTTTSFVAYTSFLAPLPPYLDPTFSLE